MVTVKWTSTPRRAPPAGRPPVAASSSTVGGDISSGTITSETILLGTLAAVLDVEPADASEGVYAAVIQNSTWSASRPMRPTQLSVPGSSTSTTSSVSQDGWALAWAHDRGEYGPDRERRGPGQVDPIRVEQPLDLKSVHHRDDRFRC